MAVRSEAAPLQRRGWVPSAVSSLTWEGAAFAALVAVGWVLRLVRYAHDRSLWGDEARLALNLRDRSFTGLVHPLAYIQAAPTGFLLAEKVVVRALGDSEYSLRLLPLAAGLASLAVFAALARRTLPRAAALVAVAFYAILDPLVYYSSEVKQYSFDPLAAVVLLLVAAPALVERRLTLQRGIVLLVAGAISFWFSHPSVFVAGAIWIALAVRRTRMPFKQPVALVVLGGVWLAVFAAAYALVLRNAQNVSNALGLGSATSHGVADVLRDGWHTFAYPDGFAYTSTALAAALACVGCIPLLRRVPGVFAALILTVALTAFAAVIGRYPFYDRFVLFLVPVALLLIAAGLDVLRESHGPTVRIVWAVILVLLAAYPVGQAAAHLVSPPGHEEIKPVLRHIASEWRPGDSLYVSVVAQYPLRYYAECNDCGVLTGKGASSLRSLVLTARGGTSALHSTQPNLEIGHVDYATPELTYIHDFRQMLGHRRVWFLFTSTWDDTEARHILDCLGHRLDAITATRAAGYLYDMAVTPDARGPLCASAISAR